MNQFQLDEAERELRRDMKMTNEEKKKLAEDDCGYMMGEW